MQDGGINPSSIAVIDEDLCYVAVDGESFGDDCDCEDAYHEYHEADSGMDDDHVDYDEVDVQLGAPIAHEFATGNGVVVAVLDGGFNLRHPALDGRLAGWGYDAIDRDGDPHDTGNGIDDNRDGVVDGGVGHGTFVAGMVLKAAPDALILPIRVRDDEGYGTNEELTRGLRYAMDMGADVINLSVEKAKVKQKGLRNAIDEARERGIVIVCSAGNDGRTDTNDLVDRGDALVVGAVDGADVIADFSNYEDRNPSFLMVFAPGVDLYGPIGKPWDGAMGWWSGTSFSAGLVSGAAALILERHPEYGPHDVRMVVEESTDPVWFADGARYLYGGRINLARAVER